MPQIILKNTKRGTFMATEYHEDVCRRRGTCKCRVDRIPGPRGKPISRKNPSSFHIFGGEKSKPLDQEVLFLQQVKDALKSGWLVREKEPVAPAVAASKPTTRTAPATADEGGN